MGTDIASYLNGEKYRRQQCVSHIIHIFLTLKCMALINYFDSGERDFSDLLLMALSKTT